MNSLQRPQQYTYQHMLIVTISAILVAIGIYAVSFSLFTSQYSLILTEQKVRPITSDSLLSKIQSSEDFMLIDVREFEEYAQEHIANSIHIPVGSIWDAVNDKRIRSDDIVVLYSNGENRSGIAGSVLTGEPFLFTNVYVLRSGLDGWKTKQYALVGALHAQHIDPLVVADLMSRGEYPTILDVRPTEEYNAMHLRLAISMPIETLPESYESLPKSALVVIIDTEYSEGYSFLSQRGFTNVKVLDGGTEKWKELGFGTEQSNL